MKPLFLYNKITLSQGSFTTFHPQSLRADFSLNAMHFATCLRTTFLNKVKICPIIETDPPCNSIFYVDHKYFIQTAKLVRYFECSGVYENYHIDFDGNADFQQK
jgi:hypothetical protein